MDSSSSSISSLATSDAAQFLKDILNVGKPHSKESSVNSVSTSSERQSSEQNGPSLGAERVTENGQAVLAELIKSMSQQVITRQQILLTGDDQSSSFSVYGREVDVVASKASSASRTPTASNKVRINPVVKFDWEHKYYMGDLVAVHRNAIHIAYVLRGTSGGVVRVINRKTAERALLKGFHGKVTDVSFAHITPVVLGAVDEIGNMFIYEIIENTDGKIDVSLLLQINRPEETVASDNHRLIWCPYIPEEEDSSGTTANTTTDSSISEDVGKLLVLTHDELAEMWNVDTVTKEYGSGPLLPSEVESGYLTIQNHTQPIVDAAFSPDGTALATASMDGDVKFFQVYMPDKSPPRCLHQWQPHDGKPVSSLFFLDDHKHPNSDVQFWKFAVTGADHNREIKVWSCESWTCLQTLRFSPPPDMPSNFAVEPCIKAAMDLSATYLVLSDIKRKVLYILQLYQDTEAGTAHVSSISEFLLALPSLSFSILDASRRKIKSADPEVENLADVTTGEVGREEEEEEEVGQGQEGSDIGVVVKMYSVHTKVIQELQIRFKPNSSTPQPPPASTSSVSHDGLRDQLSDMSLSMDIPSDAEGMPSDRSRHSDASLHGDRSREPSEPKPVLMTPDAFTTSPRKGELQPTVTMVTDSVHSSGSSLSSFTHVTAMDDDPLRTPHGSVVPSQPSPGSSVTLTPSSSRDLSGGSHIGTPTSVPMTSVTHSEQVTPTNSLSGSKKLDRPTTPPSAGLGTFPSAPSLTSSPATSRGQDKMTTDTSQSIASDREVIVPPDSSIDDIFGSHASRRSGFQSTGSSSSTSLEVSEILEGAKKPGEEAFEENVEEDIPEAEELGAEQDSQEENGTPRVREGGGVPPEGFHSGEWPQPPDIPEVNMEAQRLAVEAIERAAAIHMAQTDMEGEVRVHTHENSPAGPEQADDDVCIEEEEKEEEEEETEEQPLGREDSFIPKSDSTSGGEREDSLSMTSSTSSPRKPDRPRRTSPRMRGNRNASGEPAISAVDLTAVNELQASVQQMLTLLQTQQREIESLKTGLQRQQQNADSMSSLQSQIDNLEDVMVSKVVGALSQHSQTESQRLTEVLSEKESQEKIKHDNLMTTVSQTLEHTISHKLERTIKDEVHNAVIPALNRLIEPVKNQLHLDMAQKLTSTDALMKENISKLVRSRQTFESIGQAAGNAIQGPIQAACRDIVIPGMDRACQNVFHQVNNTFQQGTQEYVRQLESHLEQVRRRHEEGRDPVVGQLKSMVDGFHRKGEAMEPVYNKIQNLSESLETNVAQIQTSQAELDTRIQHALSSFEDRMLSQLRQLIQDEVVTAVREQQTTISDSVMNVLRSGAVTPVPVAASPDPQQQQAQILQLLRQGQLDTAFQRALSVSDLNMVMFVCETVNPAQVFNQTPCPLQQPVLLSLIQQLSADLTNNTELKHKYLEEAIMNLDTSNLVTREHMPSVLGGLCQKLAAFVNTHPQDKMARSMRMLLMASQSLLK